MPILPQLLIASPTFQDALVDKNGLPLAAGVVTMYQDNSRTTLKNWYYQTGTPGAYNYAQLPNPMTLSAAGTIVDVNGQDTIPFFYPVSEVDNRTSQPYYVTVDNSNGQRQFTRQNFPFIAPGTTPSNVVVPTLKNYIVNNVFWRNIGSVNATTLTTNVLSGLPSVVLAPSQHESLRMPDFIFSKDVNGAADTINFFQFSGSQVITGDNVTPEYYCQLHCTGAGSETVKYFQIPISTHILSMSNAQNCTITLDAMAVTGSPQITLQVLQDLGSGVAAATPVTVGTFTLSNAWNKIQTLTFPMPSAQGITPGVGNDDGLYLQIGMPVGSSGICQINFTKPSVYLSATVPNNDLDTYDQVAAIINSPRTGDIRNSMNMFGSAGAIITGGTMGLLGWVPCSNGSIGSSASTATTANANTWPLYNLLWNNVNNAFCPVTGGRGANAYADFSGNKPITITQIMGYALMGLAPAQTFTYANGTGIFTVGNANLYYFGTPVILSNSGGALPSAFSANTPYYVIPISGTTFQLASSYANAIASTAITGGTNGTGTNTVTPALGGFFGENRHTQLEAELATHSHAAGTGFTFVNHSSAGGSTNLQTAAGSDIGFQSNTATDGSSTPFNVVHPSIYVNVFLKL